MTAAAREPPIMPTPEQRRAADPAHSVWVAASAGSGKTQVLTDRLLRLLLLGIDPQQILCLTYTKAAATEMASRLFARLSDWIRLSDAELSSTLSSLGVDGASPQLRKHARRLFAIAMETPGGLKIQTIHSFAERLLQLFPVEAGLAPGFRVMNDLQAEDVRREALHAALLEPRLAQDWTVLAELGLRRMESLHSLTQEVLRNGEHVLAKISKTGRPDVERALHGVLGIVDPRSADELKDAIISIDRATYRDWSERLKNSPEQRPDDQHHYDLLRIAESSDDQRLQAIEDYYLTSEGAFRKQFARKKHLQSAGIAEAFEQERLRLKHLFEALWLRRIFEATLAVLEVMAQVRAHIEAIKRARGLYDFDDLVSRAAQLLSTVEQTQWVQYKLDKSIAHVLVDEAQDTSPLQWQIILSLVQEFFSGHGQRDDVGVRTVFVVGDRKQSIFSFQGADVTAFDRSRNTLSHWAGKTLQSVSLNVSYRSLKHILTSVDAVFAEGRRPREGYGRAAADERGHQHHRNDAPGIVELWDLETRDDQEEIDYWKNPVDAVAEDHPRRKLARRIADTLKGWIGKRCLVGTNRTVSAGDILILVQRRGMLFALLIAELRRRNIRVAGADRLRLSDHIIVHDLLALARALLLPDDDYSLACLLKSPLMPQPLDDDDLFALAHGRKEKSLLECFKASRDQAANLEAFNHYADLLEREGPFGFFAQVAQINMHAIIARLGSEAEDAIRALLDLALTYEQDEDRSIAGFCAAVSSSELVIKREFEEAADQVRIMTVHGAKGLESPIVILADAADVGRSRDDSNIVEAPSEHAAHGWPIFVPDNAEDLDMIRNWKAWTKERNFQESMRLLYVAMTRARDELYICGSFAAQRNMKEPSKDSWYGFMKDAFLRPEAGFRRIERPDGRNSMRLGPDDVYVGHAEKPTGPERLPDLPAWISAPVDSFNPTGGWRVERQGDNIDLASARHGIAVHSLMEALPEWPAAERRAKAMARARRNGLTPDLTERLLSLIERPDTAFFFAEGSHAEVSIGGRLQTGEYVMARLDRLAWHDGALCVLDYKSARRPQTPLAVDHPYVSQLRRYAGLLREAYPGTPVRAALFWTQDGEVEWIPETHLVCDHADVARLQS